MTDKKLKVSNAAYTELAIQIATLSMKVDKILELLNEPQEEYVITQDIRVTGALPGHGASFVGVIDYIDKSSHFDARDPEITRVVNKAIAELSDNENFEDSYK